MRGGESSTVGSSGKSSSREMYRPGEDASSSFRRRGGHGTTTSGGSPRGEGGSLGYEEELFGASGSAPGSGGGGGGRVEVANGDEGWRRENASVPSTPKNNNRTTGEPTVNLMNGILDGALGLPYCS